MKVSIQNDTVMVTLPQAKAKARALTKYIEHFGEASPSGLDKKCIDGLRHGGTVRAVELVTFHKNLKSNLAKQSEYIEHNFETILNQSKQVGRAFEYDPILGAMALDLTQRQQEEHNIEADMIMSVGDYLLWMMDSQKIVNIEACAVLANDLIHGPENLAETFEDIRFYEVLRKHTIKDASQMSPFSQYAYALRLISELGQPQLVDELLRVEELAA
jgi:hypothetical protein